MATVYITSDSVVSYSNCAPWNGAGSAVLGDSNALSGWTNNYGTTAANVILSKSGSMPASFIGSTINAVYLYHQANPPNLQYGTGSKTIYLGNGANSTSVALSNPMSSSTSAVSRPGGGSWVYTDFYTSSTWWGFGWNGDADAANKSLVLEELWIRVDYTPATTPVAEFTVSTTTGTSPLTVNFTDQSTNTPTSWAWSFGDGNTASTQNPSNVFTTNATTTYTVILTATNGGGTDTETKASLITVDPSTVAVAANFAASTTSGVQNLGVQFTDESAGTPAPASWIWNFGDGSSTTTSQHPYHVYTTVGTYTVTLTVENTTPTTDTETKTSYITVLNGKPVPAASCSTTTGVRPLTVQFTGSATNAVPFSWIWDFGDGAGSVAQSPIHTYQTIGTYTPLLTVTNAIGTATTTTGPITVGFDTVTASFTAGPVMGYIPLTTRFTDLSQGDAFSWSWNFGDGSTGYGQHPVHTYTTTAVGATLTVTETGHTDPYWLRYGLTNYWKMEEATGTGARADYIGSKNLTPSASTTQVTGKNGYASSVTASHNMVNTSMSDSAAFSYSLWFKTNSISGTSAYLVANRGSVPGWTVSLESGYLKLSCDGISSATGTTLLTTGTWYHLVVTWDGTSVYKLYLNGVLEATTSGSASATSNFTLSSSAAQVRVFDEVGRYAHEMTQAQIDALYNAGTGLFFPTITASDTQTLSTICPINPDPTWGYFFEELKYQMMEPVWELDVCQGFDAYGGMAKAVDLTHKRLHRFVLETGALRKEGTLSTAITDTEDFALPTDLIELLRVEVDGVPYYKADPYQRDMESDTLNYYFENDALTITIPGTFGTTPTVKVWYTYVPAAPSVPAPCTCPTPPAVGPWAYFPLPYVLWWIIKYGVAADMLNQPGERNDPTRAQQCEKIFMDGVKIYNMLYSGRS